MEREFIFVAYVVNWKKYQFNKIITKLIVKYVNLNQYL
jgi:hypothetical protein